MKRIEKVRKEVRKDLEQQAKYYNYIRDNKPDFWGGFERSEAPINERLLRVLGDIEARYAPQTQTKPVNEGPTTIQNTAKPDSNQVKDSGNQP